MLNRLLSYSKIQETRAKTKFSTGGSVEPTRYEKRGAIAGSPLFFLIADFMISERV